MVACWGAGDFGSSKVAGGALDTGRVYYAGCGNQADLEGLGVYRACHSACESHMVPATYDDRNDQQDHEQGPEMVGEDFVFYKVVTPYFRKDTQAKIAAVVDVVENMDCDRTGDPEQNHARSAGEGLDVQVGVQREVVAYEAKIGFGDEQLNNPVEVGHEEPVEAAHKKGERARGLLMDSRGPPVVLGSCHGALGPVSVAVVVVMVEAWPRRCGPSFLCGETLREMFAQKPRHYHVVVNIRPLFQHQ